MHNGCTPSLVGMASSVLEMEIILPFKFGQISQSAIIGNLIAIVLCIIRTRL